MKVGDKVKVVSFCGRPLRNVEGEITSISRNYHGSNFRWFTVKIEKTGDDVVFIDEKWVAVKSELEVIDSPEQK